MKKALALICAAVLLLGGCSRQTGTTAASLDLWVTSRERAEVYQALAESWNKENPQEPIQLNISVYSSQSIASKFSWGFSVSAGYSDSGIPDLVELDYAAFPEFVFQQTADLYPLQNMLDKNRGTVEGLSMYSKNDICFALPYRGQRLVLCYRLDLEESFPDFRRKAASFEGLMELGIQYAETAGEGLLWVDYLGSETFLALYAQALEGREEPEEAYEQVVTFLKEAQKAEAWGVLPSGDAYSDSLPGLLKEGKVPCFVTTQENLASLARQEETIARLYGVMGLPSFDGTGCRVDAPTVAVAVHMSGGDPVLSRNFLEYCRFSEAARAYPAFYLGEEGPELESLSDTYRLLGTLARRSGEQELTAIGLSGYLTDYSLQVLGDGLP